MFSLLPALQPVNGMFVHARLVQTGLGTMQVLAIALLKMTCGNIMW